jgi:hypothetical protein
MGRVALELAVNWGMLAGGPVHACCPGVTGLTHPAALIVIWPRHKRRAVSIEDNHLAFESWTAEKWRDNMGVCSKATLQQAGIHLVTCRSGVIVCSAKVLQVASSLLGHA